MSGFDAVTAFMSLMDVADPERTLLEVAHPEVADTQIAPGSRDTQPSRTNHAICGMSGRRLMLPFGGPALTIQACHDRDGTGRPC
jgi:hypothetical protein